MDSNTWWTLLMFFGPMIVPRAVAFYRSISTVNPQNIRSVPPKSRRALNLLFITALIFLVSTIPRLGPENIFHATQSRLKLATGTLFSRLAGVRELTPQDDLLREKFESLENRKLYLQYGPSVLLDCPFCTAANPLTYIYYAIPSILTPHLAHLLVLGLSTSLPIAGRAASTFRSHATHLGVLLALAEVYAVYASPTYLEAWLITPNPNTIPYPFFWRLRLFRGLAIAACDILLAAAIYLVATNRWAAAGARGDSAAEKTEQAVRNMEGLCGKLTLAGAMRNTIFRDAALKKVVDEYWVKEKGWREEVHQEREVVEGLNRALGRVDVDALGRQMGEFTDRAFESLRPGDDVMQGQ
ncbi:hypothetical protein K402DRAFT_419872 [Aulographum hederae CBS 113979]|uniref:Uncharacterized protein n=1 Tax=Aulographum hederae CBS 113979 TaxID=1176131 RepID=A0A6G1H4S2_9PEZI|nr:hypothetical protein K402DRAFT_419872 [Aulographum hederae CBS 113979]